MRKSHKEELYNVAFRLFILDSFDGVSIPDIEKASGFTRGAIFYYADTKQALYQQVMEHYLLEKQSIDNQWLSEGSDARLRLEDLSLLGFIDHYVDAIEDAMKNLRKVLGRGITKMRSSRAYLKLPFQIAERLPGLHQRQLAMMKRELELWKSALVQARDSGEIRSGIEAESVAKLFVDLIYGESYTSAVIGDVDTEKLRGELHALYALL